MRVLLVVGHASGGIGAHVDSLARDLPGLGDAVTVFTTAATAERFPLGRPTATVVTAWPSVPALRRLVTRHDVVHAHGHQAGLLAVLAAVGTGVPVVVTWHNVVLGSGARRRVLALAERVQARRATLVTGASDDLVARARALGARRAELTEVAAPPLPGGPRGGPGADAGRLTSSRPVVVTVSRIAPQKRLDVLVAAAARLARRHGDVTWLVAGDGDRELLARLERLRDEQHAPVEFLGARDDVADLLRGADVFALASEWEARALVVQEAMAAGVPVVATDVGGVPGLLGGTGVLVPTGDADALADAVGDLLADPDRRERLGGAGRARYEQLPTEADVVSEWSRRYARLTRPEQDTAR